MNLPNILTMSRCLFAVLIVLFLLANSLPSIVAATLLFLAASITDYYDGYLAKKQGIVSDFGKIMDPIADKILMLSVFLALAYLGLMEWWMVLVIGVREVAVTISRLNAMAKGQVLAAEKAGKLKTVCQMASVGLALLFLICEQSQMAHTWFYKIENTWRCAIQIMMLASVALTLSSGIMYFRNKWDNSKA